MSLLDTIRGAVAIADVVTRPLQPLVQFRHYVSSDAFGAKIYNPDVSLPAAQLHAIVDWKQKQVRTQAGILTVSRASVMFLNIAEVVVATGGEGIDDNDLIVLPDGTTGPILDMSGFIDAGTGHPVATEVFIG